MLGAGHRLAVILKHQRSGCPAQLVLLEASGRQLGSAPVPDTFAPYAWSGDGSYLCCSCHHAGLVSVHVMPAAEPEVRWASPRTVLLLSCVCTWPSGSSTWTQHLRMLGNQAQLWAVAEWWSAMACVTAAS